MRRVNQLSILVLTLVLLNGSVTFGTDEDIAISRTPVEPVEHILSAIDELSRTVVNDRSLSMSDLEVRSLQLVRESNNDRGLLLEQLIYYHVEQWTLGRRDVAGIGVGAIIRSLRYGVQEKLTILCPIMERADGIWTDRIERAFLDEIAFRSHTFEPEFEEFSPFLASDEIAMREADARLLSYMFRRSPERAYRALNQALNGAPLEESELDSLRRRFGPGFVYDVTKSGVSDETLLPILDELSSDRYWPDRLLAASIASKHPRLTKDMSFVEEMKSDENSLVRALVSGIQSNSTEHR